MSRRILLYLVLPAVIVLVVVGLRYRWHGLDPYVPHKEVSLRAAFRTMAEHDAFMRDKQWPYVLRLEGPGGGVLVYYGSWHTDDPDDPQIAQMRELWRDLQPTVALTENRLGFFIGGLRQGISVFNEFAVPFALGNRDDIPVYTLEPTWDIEVAEMKAAFPADEVALFYTLRVFLGERGSVGSKSPDEIDDLAAHLLRKRGGRPGLAGSLPDLQVLDELWDRRFDGLGPWRELPPQAVHPAANPTRLQALATLANEVRDRYAVRVILDLMSRGERVFAVAGGSHVVKQEPVLRAGVYPSSP